jgi:peptide/nickel transport system permease protein
MAGFLARRTGTMLLVLFVTSILVFLGIRAVPGSPVTVLSGQLQGQGQGADDPKLDEWIRHKYLLDKPLPEQYAHWMWLVLHGDLGRDQNEQPIGRLIASRLPISLEIAFLGVLVGAVVGIPLGLLAAVRRGRPTDHVTTGATVVAMSVPNIWLALLLITWFAVDLHWLPAGGYRSVRHPLANLDHLVLPVIVVAYGIAASVARQTRTSMVDSLGSEYVRTARAKGLDESAVVGRHALRNSLITVVTGLGLAFAALITGLGIVETVFGIPGFGQLTIDAVGTRDYPLVQAVVLVGAVGYVLASFLVDVAYSLLNPRVRLS